MKNLQVLLVAAIGLVSSAAACTGFYVGKKSSADGTTLIGRTVDLTPWTICFRTVVVPRVENTPGRVHRGLNGFSWPLPATTWRYASTPSVTSFGRGRFDSACVNEKGLAVSGTVTGYVRSQIKDADPYVKGGIAEENLPGLLIASCSTAREAVELLGKVMAEKGSREPNIYMMADPEEAWYVETYTGHQWAAVRLPDEGAAVFGNRFMLRGFDPSADGCMASPGIVSMPEKAGLLVRDSAGRIDLFRTYGGGTADYSNLRTWYGRHVLAPVAHPEYLPKEPGELIFRPERKVSCFDIFSLMRSRYEGTKWCPETSGDKSVRLIGTTKQATSHVISVSDGLPRPIAATMWVAHGPADYSVFLPISAMSRHSEESYVRDFNGRRGECPKGCAAVDFRRLAALAALDRKMYGTGVRRYWENLESRMMSRWTATLRRAGKAHKDNPAQAAQHLTNLSCKYQSEALWAARFLMDDLLWYITANNRIPGDVYGARPFDVKPYAPPPRTTMPLRAAWPSRENAKAKEIAMSGGTFDLVFVGDSITHNWENANRGKEVCDRLAKTYSILNLGYSGNCTENVIWRLENGELDGYAAKLFMVMIGLNNGADSAEDVALGIRKIVDLIRRRQPQAKVLLLPIFPHGKAAGTPTRTKNAKVNAIIKGYADGKNVLWCDFNDQLLAPDGTYPAEIAPDGTHPHGKGYEIWLSNVLPYFRQACGK